MDDEANQIYLWKMSFVKRKLCAANVLLGRPHLVLALSGLNGSTEEIVQAMAQRVEKVKQGS